MSGWFGEDWGAPCCREDEHRPTPVGTLCAWCGEAIADGDQGIINLQGYTWHRDCHLRGAIGGYHHLMGACTCCGGTEPPDPPYLTRRVAAALAVQVWERQHHICPVNYELLDGGRAILCVHCGKVSYNAGDVANRYCAACKRFYP